METKIFILSPSHIDSTKHIDLLKVALNKSAASKVCSDYIDDYKHMDILEFQLAIKNNSMLYSFYKDERTYGITLDEFYKANIFDLSIKEFNCISENLLGRYDILVVWLDESKHNNDDALSEDIIETNFLVERLDYVNYLYFLNEKPEDVSRIVEKYCMSNQDERNKILQEYL